MNVLFLCDHYYPYIGGAEVVNRNIAEYFSRKHDVSVVTRRFKGAQAGFEKLNGVKFSDEDILFGGFLGAGINYNITPAAFLGLEGKYLWTDKTDLSDSGWRQKHKLDGWLATFNIGFRF